MSGGGFFGSGFFGEVFFEGGGVVLVKKMVWLRVF